MKRYIIYAAIIFLAAYFGDKEQSQSSQSQSSIVKSDTSFIATGKNSAAAIRDTVNVTYRSQLSANR